MDRQKRPHKKVRTGCETCKRRHVKCDESRPKCTRCEKWGWDCNYTPPPTWMFSPELDEKRALTFFREKTAPLFCGDQRFSVEFFTNFIPQIAASDLTIWHLTVGIGARHEGSLQLANKHHSAALWIMSRSLSQMPVDVALLACMLLGAHANVSGEDPNVATYHLLEGLRILNQTGRRASKTLSDFVDPMFANLELTFAFLGPPQAWKSLMPYDEVRPEIVFEDVMGARGCFYDLLRWRFYAINNELATLEETDGMFEEWRRKLSGIAGAEAMLFQYKMFTMCRAAKITKSRVTVLLVDLSDRSRIDMITSFVGDMSETWKPLEKKEEFSIWPKGAVTGMDGENRVIRITLVRDATAE